MSYVHSCIHATHQSYHVFHASPFYTTSTSIPSKRQPNTQHARNSSCKLAACCRCGMHSCRKHPTTACLAAAFAPPRSPQLLLPQQRGTLPPHPPLAQAWLQCWCVCTHFLPQSAQSSALWHAPSAWQSACITAATAAAAKGGLLSHDWLAWSSATTRVVPTCFKICIGST